MAHCPKCAGEIGATTAVCPHCGYDWPPADSESAPAGWEHSEFADFALVVGAGSCGLGCAAAVLWAIYAAVQQAWVVALILCPSAFLSQFGLLVLFVREIQRSRPRS